MSTISFRTDLPDSDAFFALFETTGWNAKYQAAREDLQKALDNSWYSLSAYDKDRLVGFGRIVCDGSLHAMIYELIVHPEYQGRGIGSEILRRLVDVCRTEGIRDVRLFAARGMAPFYEKRGFAARPSDAPGMEFVAELHSSEARG